MRILDLPSREFIAQHSTRPIASPRGYVAPRKFTPEQARERHLARQRACMARLRAERKKAAKFNKQKTGL
jgi:hypothetical protein